jgi:hypothetical protein
LEQTTGSNVSILAWTTSQQSASTLSHSVTTAHALVAPRDEVAHRLVHLESQPDAPAGMSGDG